MTDTPPPGDDDDDEAGPTASGPTLPAQVTGPVAVPDLVDDDEDDEDDDDPFGLGDLLGGGGLDLGGLMEQASQMQQQMAEAQAEAARTVLEGVAGGGAVKVTVTGAGEFRSITIDPGAVDPDDVALLEDLVLAALHDATARIQALQADAMGGLGGLLGGTE
jgi:nucleoid-associated protein EbfC